MGIRLRREDLELTLDAAIQIARSPEALSVLWQRRVEKLGELGVVTYVAALGGALIAKATNDNVDSLAQDVSAGPRGYSLRTATEFLASHNEGRFHMGTRSKNPVNNAPFLRGPHRIDEFEKIHSRARQSYELFLDCLTDLNRMSSEEALRTFAVWLRIRMNVEDAARFEDRIPSGLLAQLSPVKLVDIASRFVLEDPEGGRRGQSFVAAVLDCAFEGVVLQPINNPHPGDIRLSKDDGVACIVEVKQVAMNQTTAIEVAASARMLGASIALIVVLATEHRPLDREALRRQALDRYQVFLEVAESVGELIGTLAVFSVTPIDVIVARLPANYEARMREHGVSLAAQKRWAQLIRAQYGA